VVTPDEPRLLPNEDRPRIVGTRTRGRAPGCASRRPEMKKKSAKGKKKVRDLAVKSSKGGSVKGGLSSIKMRQ